MTILIVFMALGGISQENTFGPNVLTLNSGLTVDYKRLETFSKNVIFLTT